MAQQRQFKPAPAKGIGKSLTGGYRVNIPLMLFRNQQSKESRLTNGRTWSGYSNLNLSVLK
jgi:hypothetical protein